MKRLARRSRSQGRWAAGILAAVMALAPVGGRAPASAAGAVTVTLAPTTATDGQAVTITVKAPAGVTVNEAAVNTCRRDVAFSSGPGVGGGPPLDFLAEGGNCPPSPPGLSTSGSGRIGYPFTVMTHAADPNGVGLRYLVGAGTAKWKAAGGKDATLTCDSDNGCDIVVELSLSEGSAAARWQPFKLALTYAGNDPFGGCGGPANGVLRTGAADRMIDTWVNWTIGECSTPGRKGAAGGNSFAGEREAVRQFGTAGDTDGAGPLDLAYTGAGYDDQVGLGPPADARRAAVPVPVALNAAVIAVAGGDSSSGVQVPYQDIKLTVAEAARLVSAGSFRFSADPEPPATANNKSYEELALARNPQLKGSFFQNSDVPIRVGVDSTASAVSWFATRMFSQLAPDAWRVPDASLFGSGAGKARGIDAAFGEEQDPSYDHGPDLLSGRSALVKALVPVATSSLNGGIYVLTDLATANALGLSPVQIQNAAGQFVAPNADTLAAAVPKMARDSYGVLISDPKAAAADGQVQPYPLTLVEYALAPAEPLLAGDCTGRTQSQALLKGWLQYIIGAGQSRLAPGMVPLTPALKTEASSAIGKVGASPVTGTCKSVIAQRSTTTTKATTTTKPKSTTTIVAPLGTGSASNGTAGSTGGGSGGDAGGFFAGPTGSAAGDPPAPTTAPAPATTTATTKPVEVAVPAYAGKVATSYGGMVLGLFGLLGLAALAAVGGVPLRSERRGRREGAPAPARPLHPG